MHFVTYLIWATYPTGASRSFFPLGFTMKSSALSKEKSERFGLAEIVKTPLAASFTAGAAELNGGPVPGRCGSLRFFEHGIEPLQSLESTFLSYCSNGVVGVSQENLGILQSGFDYLCVQCVSYLKTESFFQVPPGGCHLGENIGYFYGL